MHTRIRNFLWVAFSGLVFFLLHVFFARSFEEFMERRGLQKLVPDILDAIPGAAPMAAEYLPHSFWAGAFLILAIWGVFEAYYAWKRRAAAGPVRLEAREPTREFLDFRRLVSIRLKAAAQSLHHVAKEIGSRVVGVQKDGGRQYMDLIHYGINGTANSVMRDIEQAANGPPLTNEEIAKSVSVFLDHYKELQHRIIPILDAWGSNDVLDDGISNFLAADRNLMPSLQELTEQLGNQRLRTDAWSLGLAESRFRKLIGKRYRRASDRI